MDGYASVGEKPVKDAVTLVEYFKAHVRRVHTKLGDSAKQNSSHKSKNLLPIITLFLKSEGGGWEGPTSQLYKIFTSTSVAGLPGGEGPFGKLIREIANNLENGIVLEEGHRGKQHVIKLSLSTLGTVGVKDARTETTEGKTADEKATSDRPEPVVDEDHLAKIRDAVEMLFNEYPEHSESPDPEAIAVELFWWDYLDYIPDEGTVEVALGSWQANRREDTM